MPGTWAVTAFAAFLFGQTGIASAIKQPHTTQWIAKASP
jgi:hypothetical protein